MWARVVECMLAAWLAMSPFIFRHPDGETALWLTDWLAALLMCVFALSSYWLPLNRIHLANVLVACALIGFGRFYGDEVTAAHQNQILVGLLLLMFALVPNQAADPPQNWSSAKPVA